jgi:hypothetical protein
MKKLLRPRRFITGAEAGASCGSKVRHPATSSMSNHMC